MTVLSTRARDAFELASSVSGYPLVLESDPTLDVWSIARIPRKGETVCKIRYHPEQRKFLDYLIAHECGHIYRFFSAQPADRVLPAMDSSQMRRAREEVAKESWSRKRAIPKHVRDEFLTMLCSGLVRQLTNTPADCRIEAWIYQNFEMLRVVQADALQHQYSTFLQCLRPEIKEGTPGSVYEKSNTMNYVLAKEIGNLLHEPAFIAPYVDQGFSEMGEKLDSHLSGTDDGYATDIRASDAWAKELRIEGWYRWFQIG